MVTVTFSDFHPAVGRGKNLTSLLLFFASLPHFSQRGPPCGPGIGLLLWLFPLPGTLSPQQSAWPTSLPLSSFGSRLIFSLRTPGPDYPILSHTLSFYHIDPHDLTLASLSVVCIFLCHLASVTILHNLLTYSISCMYVFPSRM